MNDNKRLYRAIVWGQDPNKPGERVSVLAEDLDEAKRQLEKNYGEGNVFDLHNVEDADKPRSNAPGSNWNCE